MVRNYKKKTNRGEVPAEIFKAASIEISYGHLSFRAAAEEYGVDKTTLFRYYKKWSSGVESPKVGYARSRKEEPLTTGQTANGDCPESRTSYTPKQPPLKKQKELEDPVDRQNELLKLACDLLSSSSKQEETNECLDIGKVWGTKLMSLEPMQRKFAEKAINDVLFEADLGTLHRNSVQIN